MVKRCLLVGLVLTLVFVLVPGYTQVRAVASPEVGWTRLSDPMAAGGSISHLIASPSNPDILYALQAGPHLTPKDQHLVRSQDNGVTWQIIHSENHYFTSLVVDPQNPDILYAIENNQLLKSINAGITWVLLYPIGMDVIVPEPDQIILTGQLQDSQGHYGNHLIRSLDGGLNWGEQNRGAQMNPFKVLCLAW